MDQDLLVDARIEAVRRASKSLAELIEEDPEATHALAGDASLPDRAAYVRLVEGARSAGGLGAVRSAKRRALLGIAARDLAGEVQLDEVGRALADLADACLEIALDDLGASEKLAVIGMGKLGGRELNYASDIDVMFVAADDVAAATKAAEAVLRELGAVTPEGQAFRIDANLRPEGRSGALVRSLDGYVEYYRRWAHDWEYQALLKARASAGNPEVGSSLVEVTRSLVYPPEVSTERIAGIRKMKERVEDHAARSLRRGGKSREGDDVKLGPGGIRDIEFSVQLLQLVHGGADPTVRDRSTLGALSALVEGGYIADDDGAGLSVAYRWLRTVEHRLQLWQERQVHTLPADEESLTRVARVMGFRDSPSAGAADRFRSAHKTVLADVRNRFEKLFYRPMIESLAEGDGRLSEAALKDRLRVLGFRDVDRSARTLDGLVSGTSRRARLFRVLTPAMLRWLAATPLPDEGLFSFLRLGEALSGRLDTLGALRDNPPAIAFLARVLGSGRIIGEVLAHVPEELAVIADPRGPGELKPRDRLVHESIASLEWRAPDRRLDGVRRFKRREFLRIVLADLAGGADVGSTGEALSNLADACLEAALRDSDVSLAVVGMGKLGGGELNYSSDIDVMFVHRGDTGDAERAAEALMRAIGEVTPEGQAFRIDAALRPEGKSGPLTRSLDSYLEYYSRWARPWEHLALIKARWAAGDRELGEELVARTRELAFPDRFSAEALAEIRHLKARMERERIPRGTDRRRHLKLGPGGLSDIEFAVQLLQVQHGAAVPDLRVPGTVAALDAVRAAAVIDDSDADRLAEAYSFLMSVRNRLFLMVGRPTDVLPTRPEELEALGIAMGYSDQPRQEVEEDYLRVTRRARAVAEPLIYG